jgi:aspartate racemase
MAAPTKPKTIGIIGGLGPLAGAEIYRRLIERTAAAGDQDHDRVVLISDPKIPSREDHILRSGDSPVRELLQVIEHLESCAADVIGIGSFTTHSYYEELSRGSSVPVVNMISATADALRARDVGSVAVVGAGVSRQARLLEQYAHADMRILLPPQRVQVEIDALIGGVKSVGASLSLRDRLQVILHDKWLAGTDATLVSCTDLAPLLPHPPVNTLCVTDVLVEALIGYPQHPTRASLRKANPHIRNSSRPSARL